jgi:5S rRNA maturation endonuclease (ribonuclease M5)
LATRSGELATATKANPADQVVEPTVEGAGEGSGLGYDVGVKGSSIYPKPAEATRIRPAADDGKPLLPPDMWRDFETFADAWAYLEEGCEGYRRALWRDGDRFVVRAIDPSGERAATLGELAALDPEVAALLVGLDDQVVATGQQVEPAAVVASRRRSLRVEVFAALLNLATPSSATAAGEWLRKEKGVELATQDRFGLRFLDEWKVAAHELKDRFGIETLQSVGIYGKEKTGSPYFVFARHRLLFPFFWKGEPVDVQGRNVEAAGKDDRFRNTTGANPIPYNAGALLEARATGAPVFICEGATDTLALAQSGRLVVGIVGTGGFKPAWLEAFEGLDVYLALDSDDAGRKAAKDITKVFVAAGHRAPKVVKLPEGIKDVNQFFRSMAQ